MGGIDVLFQGLERQKFDGSFELVLVDELYDYRHLNILEYKKAFKRFSLNHIRGEISDIFAITRNANSGIRQSRGRNIFLCGDYHYLPEKFLASGCDILDSIPLSMVAHQFTSYAPPELCFLQPQLISAFVEPFNPSMFDKISRYSNHLPYRSRNYRGSIYVSETKQAQGNVALRKEDLLYLNGYDTAIPFVGCDEDLVMRAVVSGLRIFVDLKIMLQRFRFEDDSKDKKVLYWNKQPHDMEKLLVMSEKLREEKYKSGISRIDAHLGICDRTGFYNRNIIIKSKRYSWLRPRLNRLGYTVFNYDMMQHGIVINESILMMDDVTENFIISATWAETASDSELIDIIERHLPVRLCK
jgi:hypothetical protein